MAESSESSSSGQPSAALVITEEVLMGQSKSSAEEFLLFKDLPEPVHVDEGTNKLMLVCLNCKCKVMRPGHGSLTEKERFLPSMTEKYKIGEVPKGDDLKKFWLVKDMFHFENVGFSKTVNGTEQFLICADCEVGPIGWYDIENKKEIFVAAERVRYAAT